MAEDVEILDATEKVADDREKVRPACEEVAEDKRVAEVDDEADEVEPQIAEPRMEMACKYNRYAQDLVPYDPKESIQTPMEIDGDEERKETSRRVRALEREVLSIVETVNVKPSSLSEREKGLKMIELFEKALTELTKRISKKIEVEEEEIKNLNNIDDKDVVLGGVIMAGGVSKKAKKKRNNKKRGAKAEGEKLAETGEGNEDSDEFDPTW